MTAHAKITTLILVLCTSFAFAGDTEKKDDWNFASALFSGERSRSVPDGDGWNLAGVMAKNGLIPKGDRCLTCEDCDCGPDCECVSFADAMEKLKSEPFYYDQTRQHQRRRRSAIVAVLPCRSELVKRWAKRASHIGLQFTATEDYDLEPGIYRVHSVNRKDFRIFEYDTKIPNGMYKTKLCGPDGCLADIWIPSETDVAIFEPERFLDFGRRTRSR